MQPPVRACFIAAVLAASAPVLAAGGHDHGSMGTSTAASPAPQQSAAAAAMSDGLVKKVDKAAGKVTLSHGPLPNIGMTMPMTMVFRVKDAAWLDKMKEGDKIRFVADNINGAITVVRFEPAS